MRQLHLSEHTFYRCLEAMFADEKDLILNDTLSCREEMKRQIQLCRDRLLDNVREIKEWLKVDPDSKERVELMQLASEILSTIPKIYEEGPAMIARTRASFQELHVGSSIRS